MRPAARALPLRAPAFAAVALCLLAGCSDGGRDGRGTEDGEGPVVVDAFAHPFATFLCTDGYRGGATATGAEARLDRCNHRVTKPLSDPARFDWRDQHGPGNEVSIAVHPQDPLVAAGGAKDYTVSYLSDVAQCGEYTVWMGAYWTDDGGLTWGNDLMPGFPGDDRASPLAGNWCNTDPALAFDDDGTLWFNALNYDGTREDAGVVTPPGAQHDLLTGSQLYFARSDDGGAGYGPITFAGSGDDGLVFHDKQWFALQPGGDHMVATWSAFVSLPPLGLPGPVIMYSESLDAGATWTPPRAVPGGTAATATFVQDSMPQYLPGGGTVAITWNSLSASGPEGPESHLAYTEAAVTPGGLVFQPARAAFPIAEVKAGPNRDGTGPSTFRVGTIPVLAVDTSGGACDGRRYVAWADQPGPLDSDVQVLLRWSDDGLSWSAPVAVNDVAAGDQFMPWVDVDPEGGVHLAWYDRRNDAENRLLDVYYAHSDDCAESFHPNVRVTETSFDGDLSHHQAGNPFIGDYIGLDATAVSAHVIWAETRHTGQPGRAAGSDVYAATLLRDASARTAFDAVFEADDAGA